MTKPNSVLMLCASASACFSTAAMAATAPDAQFPPGMSEPAFMAPYSFPISRYANAAARVSPAADATPGRALSESAIAQAEKEAARDDALASAPVTCNGRHAQGIRYHVRRLQRTGDLQSFPFAINNAGKVVGFSIVGDVFRATLWIGTRAFDLPTLASGDSIAFDINDAGKIVGYSNTPAGPIHAVSWFGGQVRDMGALGSNSWAQAVNRFGTAAGLAARPDASGFLAVVWGRGGPRPLPTLGGATGNALGLNDRGYIVGASTIGPDPQVEHAALWTPRDEVFDLGTLGGTRSAANDIDNKGKAVGYSTNFDDSRMLGTLWYRGTIAELPGLGGRDTSVSKINERDQAVGYSMTPDGQMHGVIWFGNTPAVLENLLDDESQGIRVNAAYGINDRGQITAVSGSAGDLLQPLVLTPRPCRYR